MLAARGLAAGRLVRVIKQKNDPELERIFGAAIRMWWAVARWQWREAALVACLPAVAAALFWALPLGQAAPGLIGPVYLGAVAVALAWNLRACLGALHPGAIGARVELKHMVWRIAVACGFTLVPAVYVFVLVNSDLSAEHFSFVLAIFGAMLLTVVMYALAAVTAARVAATGRFSPLEAWGVLRGRRGVSIASLFFVFAAAAGFGGFFFLPSFALEALGAPWWIAILPGGVLAHGVILLALAAVATAVHDRAAGPPPMVAEA